MGMINDRTLIARDTSIFRVKNVNEICVWILTSIKTLEYSKRCFVFIFVRYVLKQSVNILSTVTDIFFKNLFFQNKASLLFKCDKVKCFCSKTIL